MASVWKGIVFLLLCGLFILGIFWLKSKPIEGLGSVVETKGMEKLRSDQAGQVWRVFVEKGATVQVDQPVVELINLDLEESILSLHKKIEEKREMISRLKLQALYERGSASEEMGQKVREVAKKKEEVQQELEKLKEDVKRKKELVSAKYLAKDQLKDAEEAVLAEQKQLDKLDAELDGYQEKLSKGVAQEKLLGEKKVLEQMITDVGLLEQKQQQLKLQAKVEGVVQEVVVQPGDWVKDSQVVAWIKSASAPSYLVYAVFPFEEQYLIKEGDRAVVLGEGKRFSGQVRFVKRDEVTPEYVYKKVKNQALADALMQGEVLAIFAEIALDEQQVELPKNTPLVVEISPSSL